MKIRLVSHASVIVDAGTLRIWSDPWLHGKAFNESWTLLPPAVFDEAWLKDVEYLWVSHEHPDHFHVPTLRGLPAAFKERVTVLFQANNSDKMFEAFRKFGFRRFQALPHRKIISLTPDVRVYCYHVGQMDSCLGVMDGKTTLLNVNDAEINTRDCRLIVRDIGRAEVVLNQFSLAGYSGFAEHDKFLPPKARQILQNVSDNHRDLGARITIPFASFIYFSCTDNRYINRYANTPRGVVEFMAAKSQDVAVLYPGDLYDTEQPWDSAPALARYDEILRSTDNLPYDDAGAVPLDEIETAFRKLAAHLHERYPRLLLRFLKPMRVHVPDLNASIVFDVSSGRLDRNPPPGEPDLAIRSQPLHFGFSNPYGIQTLGVSARYVLLRNFRNWRLHRILFSLNNAEIYLRPRYFFTRRNLGYLCQRLKGGLNQFVYQFQWMR